MLLWMVQACQNTRLMVIPDLHCRCPVDKFSLVLPDGKLLAGEPTVDHFFTFR